MGLELTSYIQAADDSKRTDSPAEHSALSEIVSLVMILRSKYLENALRICSNFAKTEAIMAGTYSLKLFLKKTPGTANHQDRWKT